MSTPVALMVSVLLLVANGFFVAAEFAIVAAKRHRLEERAEEGSRAARAAVEASRELSLMLAGAQLGITLCTLALGALAKPAVAHLLEPVISTVGVPDVAVHAVAVVLAVSVVVFLHMVVGEMAPKSWAISHPESSAILLALPFRAFTWVSRPLLWLMNELANVLLRLVRVDPVDTLANAQTPADLQLLLAQSYEHGVLGDADHQILSGALRLEEKTVAEVMFPTTAAVTVPRTATAADVERISRDSGRSRLFVVEPAGRAGQQRIRGIVHVRDAIMATAEGRADDSLLSFLQPVASLPSSMPLIDAVTSLRQQRAQLALVRDEQGRVVGMSSMEDILEQILGEFDDESDEATTEHASA
ncbi:hemolysin family protein [Ornithinimicrobium humiphilum]|uniref:CBS domain containing-hemolysin-like protein n=1 Tax=Ornithinimicrobium humiphilum TaxID=125288 RepID=A0A543KKL7_9MICO|nr:hemolysin family protein [Ornithinimicrobium humiphilum]TQM95632.1 CBS domain containing-hemolysin-like protein [Ornithinimicrobium humiphilum]